MDSKPFKRLSFRDPSGWLVGDGERIFRYVTADGRGDLDAFLASSACRTLVEEGRIIASTPLAGEEAEEFGIETPPDGLTLSHPRIFFPSYPYEWPGEMLHAAGELTLDVAEALLDERLGLKDATPDNVLFDGPRPVFVDVLSIERRREEDFFWLPSAQFERTFILPLLARRAFSVSLRSIFLGNPDGLDPRSLYAMASRVTRLSPSFLMPITLPTLLAANTSETTYRTPRSMPPDKARFVLGRLFRRHRRRLAALRPSAARSAWSTYDSERRYSAAMAGKKDGFVSQCLDRIAPAAVLDLGCNTGRYSAMACRAGARVVACDSDPAVVGQLWTRAREEGLDLLPLVVDLMNPSPSTGWRNAERLDFLSRVRERFDMVLVLALVHHVMIAGGVSLDEIFSFLGDMTRRFLVVEYVGPDDPMFRQLLRGRESLYTGFDRQAFETRLQRRFSVRDICPLPEMDRVLYLAEKIE